MPRLGSNDETMQVSQIGGSGFNFSGTRIDRTHLTATEYTLATIAIDETGSVYGFQKQLHDCLVTTINGCKMSPRSDNILVRVLYFGSQYDHGVHEVHGFKPLADIDPNNYPAIVPSGLTPLNDTLFSAIGATNAYGKDLRDQYYTVNGIVFVVTDGNDNTSSSSVGMVKDEIENTIRKEQLESLISILIGVNAAHYDKILRDYQKDTGITHYREVGATASELAKLANFIITSVSSQSQNVGTGGPSQNIAAII